MKIFRFGQPGKEKPGVFLSDGSGVDVSSFCSDYNEPFFAGGGVDALGRWLKGNISHLPKVAPSLRLAPPISRPSKIVCIGHNYRDHAAETRAQVPKEPVVFLKSTTAMCGPNDNVVIPRNGLKLDWEVELAVVIGKQASYVPKENALEFVAGYVLFNDYSERSFQLERGGQWVKGKSADSFAPLGPFLATCDDVPNSGKLNLWLRVNGELRQNGNTSDMIFDVPTIVSYVSEFMTLLPGDVIGTGTPAGVGLGRNPPSYLQPGDLVSLGIDGLGESSQKVVAWEK
jgi:2-keto-4-pentenoate hydratase/2-oxohepta-3-ene-1,7-dioic acid hydratase in catechol pathway